MQEDGNSGQAINTTSICWVCVAIYEVSTKTTQIQVMSFRVSPRVYSFLPPPVHMIVWVTNTNLELTDMDFIANFYSRFCAIAVRRQRSARVVIKYFTLP